MTTPVVPVRRPAARAAIAGRPSGNFAPLALTALLATLLWALAWAGPAQAKPVPEGFADLAEKLLPSVVNISTTQTVETGQGPQMPQFPPGSPLEDLFRDFFERHHPPRGQRNVTSLGSGFIIDASGLVVTNNHVIDGADEISVILNDDTVLKAELVGSDADTDVALLRLDTDRKLPALKWGDSDAARVGDWVIAIGNPFGLGGTVTSGIISAKTRDINAGRYDNFIQTDAAINRGNSGGPLFNMKGQVIGINTAIFSPSGGSVGIGFATPSNLAQGVLDDLQEYGRTRRGWLGVRIQTVTPEFAESLGLDKPRGALVASLTEDSPAASAGIRPGDVILAFNGQPVPEMRRLPRIVAETEIGQKVKAVVWRDGREQTVEVVVAELDEEQQASADPGDSGPAPQADVSGDRVAELGLTVQPPSRALSEQFGLDEGIEGLVVTDVDPDSGALAKGIRPGAVLAEVNQERLRTVDDLRREVEQAAKAGRKTVLALVLESGGEARFAALPIAPAE
ncbi:DegQ family serine endoprotease [Roseospirillum parvum]|uniref:Probable periplasmic serine endoprotease DegP-like n=1 Tax=Roseospirillum parvum TaxID=83401 RepID=A0A1G7ZUN6_9PROT|nr:DegQ family serine endoprotease [Roseospirillum parvum]SDH12392.1 serine protease Do [Roseospirillum parvum]